MSRPMLPPPRSAAQLRKSPGRAWIRRPDLLPIITEKTVWLRGSEAQLSHLPYHIARKLNGTVFPTFDRLRVEFWKAIAADDLVQDIYPSPLFLEKAKMEGVAPRAPQSQQIVAPRRSVTGGAKLILAVDGEVSGVVLESEADVESLGSYVLHHKQPIHAGGGVYDLSNLVVVTPLLHAALLAPDYHYQMRAVRQWRPRH